MRSRVIHFIALLAGCAGLSGCGGGGQDQPSSDSTLEAAAANENIVSDVAVIRNGVIAPRIEVRFEVFHAPFLTQLREREHLEDLFARSPTEFAKMLALRDWVSSQWPHGTPNPYPPWNAIAILDWIRANYTGGFCGQYSQVLLQSLAAMGMTARYVEIGSNDNPYAHFVIEAWSNEFNKWVMLDADYNVHFERLGIPLSVLEIHTALVADQMSDVVAVPGEIRQGHSDPNHWPLKTAELYYYLRYHLNANHLSAPLEPAFDRWSDMIEWNDSATVPWEQSTVASPYRKVRLTNSTVTDNELVEGALNQVVANIDSWSANQVVLSFQNNVLGFDRYQIRETNADGRGGAWSDMAGGTYVWKPKRQRPALEIRGINSRGVAGPSSIVAAQIGL
jgi:hypothetical protein